MLPEIKSSAEKPQKGTAKVLRQVESGKEVNRRRFDPNVRITEAMMWHTLDRPTTQKPHIFHGNTGPTWAHLVRQIIAGVIEILIPLAFIVGMIYWRAPWLFWALVRFLRGESVFQF